MAAGVNLPFSKFNKKLIGRGKKSHFNPDNKRPIDFSIFSWAGEEIRHTQGETQFSNALPFRICSPAVSRVLCPPARSVPARYYFLSSQGSKNSFCIIDDSALAATRAFGSVLPAAVTHLLQELPLCQGTRLTFLSPQTSSFHKQSEEKKRGHSAAMNLALLRHRPCESGRYRRQGDTSGCEGGSHGEARARGSRSVAQLIPPASKLNVAPSPPS